MTAIPQSDYPITRLPDYQMRIAVIPGDGIGVDVTAEAVKVVRAVGEVFGRQLDLEMLPYGADYYLQTGISLPPNGHAMLRDRYGFALTTASPEARDAYVAGVDASLSANHGAEQQFLTERVNRLRFEPT